MADGTGADQEAASPPRRLNNQQLGAIAASAADRSSSGRPEPAPWAGEHQAVLCMKWGTQYGPEYVNRLYGMLARQTMRSFRLVCLTDDDNGLRSEVEWYPIPVIPLPDDAPERGWRKLASFAPEIARVLGDRALFLDLDVVLMGGIDAFFEYPGDFLILRDRRHPFARIGNTSVYRFRPSRSADVLEQYCRDHELITKRFRNAREYLSWYMGDFGALEFWPKGWCASFKHDCIPWWPWNHWRAPHPPVASRIVVFDGHQKPPDAVSGGPAVKRSRAHLPAPWVGEHWRA